MSHRSIMVATAVAVMTALSGCGDRRAPPPPLRPIRNDARVNQEVQASLQRLGTLLSMRDKAIVDEFDADPDIMMLGSEAEEFAVGQRQIQLLFQNIFGLPVTLSWDWKETRVSSIGDIAWVYASGDVVMKGADGETRSPYRMTGVLERRGDGQWRWRQFHGSEPAKPAAPATK